MTAISIAYLWIQGKILIQIQLHRRIVGFYATFPQNLFMVVFLHFYQFRRQNCSTKSRKLQDSIETNSV